MKIIVDEIAPVREALREALKNLESDNSVTVGIHEDAGEHTRGITNAQLGAVLDLGDERGHIPPRPWLRPGVESAYPDLIPEIGSGLEDGIPVDVILERVGAIAAAKTQEYLTALNDPPNAPSTIRAKKGKSNPLIDTGELRQSIGYAVGPGAAEERA